MFNIFKLYQVFDTISWLLTYCAGLHNIHNDTHNAKVYAAVLI